MQKAGAYFTDDPLTVDGHIITSQNPASAAWVALTLLEWLVGAPERSFIQEQMGF